jgi:hypothetical protein
MKRLFQIGVWLMMLVTLLAPLEEYFDHWDAPGIANDTEFALVVLILSLCLILLLSRLISALALLIRLVSAPFLPQNHQPQSAKSSRTFSLLLPPLALPPLRI